MSSQIQTIPAVVPLPGRLQGRLRALTVLWSPSTHSSITKQSLKQLRLVWACYHGFDCRSLLEEKNGRGFPFSLIMGLTFTACPVIKRWMGWGQVLEYLYEYILLLLLLLLFFTPFELLMKNYWWERARRCHQSNDSSQMRCHEKQLFPWALIHPYSFFFFHANTASYI